MQTLPGPSEPRRDYLSIAQLTVSGLGLVLSLVAAAGLALFGLIQLTGSSTDRTNITGLFSMAWISLLAAVLTVPSILYSIQRLGGRAPALPRANSFRLASTLMLIWPLALFLGNVVSNQPRIAWLLLPPLTLLVVGLPTWWLFELVRRKLPSGSRQRGWGLNNFSIFITTPLLMIIEVLVLVALLVLFAFWASTQPQIMNILQGLVERLSRVQPTPDAILEIAGPYLQNPLVILGGLAIIAGLVPMIEELFKPLAMWALVGHRLTPAEGFVAGGLCGASFALIESFFYLSNPTGGGWAFLAIARAGTELLHITASALVGWGLASAWHDRAYLKLAGTYLLAVLLHGSWNAFSVLTGLAAAINNPSANLRPFIDLGKFAPLGLGLLVLLLFALLLTINRHLQVSSVPQPASIPPGQPVDASESSQSSSQSS
jgi:hypothetical protein